jgi:signal transduction histidine kinase
LIDDGRGITVQNEHGNGIANMRARAKRLAGNLEICTTAGGGTVIRVNIPLSKDA